MTFYTKLILCAALFLSACTTEPSDDELTARDFAPSKVGSQWTYTFSGNTYSFTIVNAAGEVPQGNLAIRLQETSGSTPSDDTLFVSKTQREIGGYPSPFANDEPIGVDSLTRILYQGDSVWQLQQGHAWVVRKYVQNVGLIYASNTWCSLGTGCVTRVYALTQYQQAP
jgi:hypothetical protein